MSNKVLGVCPKCGNRYGDYDSPGSAYNGGNVVDDPRQGYAFICNSCGFRGIEFWKFDEIVEDYTVEKGDIDYDWCVGD